MFRKLEENLNRFKRGMDNAKMTKIKLLDMKTTMSVEKNTLDWD
jgi:exonuclease VII small subunit